MMAAGLSWSPGEKWLTVWARTPGKNFMIYLVPSTGGEVQMLLQGEARARSPHLVNGRHEIAVGDVVPIKNSIRARLGSEIVKNWDTTLFRGRSIRIPQ